MTNKKIPCHKNIFKDRQQCLYVTDKTKFTSTADKINGGALLKQLLKVYRKLRKKLFNLKFVPVSNFVSKINSGGSPCQVKK